MPRSRRVLALLLVGLLLHTMWAGTGVACVTQTLQPSVDARGIAPAPDLTMAGMDMSGVSGKRPGDAPARDRASCDLPWAPGGCGAMAPCMPLAVVSAVQSLREIHDDHSAVRAGFVLTPPSQVRAPELPPPRG